jgi:ComF family protein
VAQGPSPCLARVAYAWPWIDLVREFKFRSQPAWAREMARMMLEMPEGRALLDSADGLVPIPLTPQRLVERGYNQAWELARHIGAAASVACEARLLQRLETQERQHQLAQHDRQDHAARAFALAPQAQNRIAGGHWVLIDDVMTTGATLRAAAQLLRDAGAQRVSAWVFARTPAGDPDDRPLDPSDGQGVE